MSDFELSSDEPVVETPTVETPPEVTPDPTPSPETTPPVETPADPTPEAPVVEEEKLYDLPDGRKVNAAGLHKEYSENLLPEFTRKSQELADFKREKDAVTNPPEVPAWKKEGYEPQTYQELIDIATGEAVTRINNTAQQEVDRKAGVQAIVDKDLADIKIKDPSVDESALFLHANKYGFSSLKHAYSNMTDMKTTVANTEKRTVKNLQEREADPISTGPGGEAPETIGDDPYGNSQFDSASDALAYIKKGK